MDDQRIPTQFHMRLILKHGSDYRKVFRQELNKFHIPNISRGNHQKSARRSALSPTNHKISVFGKHNCINFVSPSAYRLIRGAVALRQFQRVDGLMSKGDKLVCQLTG